MSRVKELYWDAIIENSEQSIWEAEQDAALQELYGQPRRIDSKISVDLSSGQRERIRETPGCVVAAGKRG